MVKGVSRRVIVVKSPDPKVFEEAIFIIREDFLNQPGVSDRQVIKEAQRAADSYIRSNVGRGRTSLFARLPAPFVAAAGAAATGVAWLAMRLVGV
jgi:hypothetical protein